MPWYNGTFPPSYKNQPVPLRDKAVEIANELLLNGVAESVAIATGLKRAMEFFSRKNDNPETMQIANELVVKINYEDAAIAVTA